MKQRARCDSLHGLLGQSIQLSLKLMLSLAGTLRAVAACGQNSPTWFRMRKGRLRWRRHGRGRRITACCAPTGSSLAAIAAVSTTGDMKS